MKVLNAFLDKLSQIILAFNADVLLARRAVLAEGTRAEKARIVLTSFVPFLTSKNFPRGRKGPIWWLLGNVIKSCLSFRRLLFQTDQGSLYLSTRVFENSPKFVKPSFNGV